MALDKGLRAPFQPLVLATVILSSFMMGTKPGSMMIVVRFLPPGTLLDLGVARSTQACKT